MLQSNQVLSFFRPRENGGDWSQRELAEFYRVENALIGSGVAIGTDRGVTDEGEPWFVFYRQDNEEVIVHFARIDGEYVVVSNLTEGVVRGRNFQTLVRELLDSHPYVLPKPNSSRRQTVYLHPATLLAALVVTGYVKSSELNGDLDDHVRAEKGSGWIFNRHDLVAYSAIVIAAVWDTLTADSSVDKFADFAWLGQANAEHDLTLLSSTSQLPDGNALLGDLVFKNGSDHSLLASTTFNFEDQGNQGSTQVAGNGLSSVTPEAKGFANQAVSQAGDAAQPSAHEPSHLAKDGDGKAGVWHTDQEQADLQVGIQLDRVVVTRPGSSSAPAEVSAPAESHSTTASTSTTTSSTNSAFAETSRALDIITTTLHIDLQTFSPVVLSVTNLTEAIQATFVQLDASGEIAAATVSSIGFTSGAHLFDDAAQLTLNQFLHDTPHYRVEAFGKDILLVDTDASHFASNHLETWTMDDGSTISIIGSLSHHAIAA